VSFLYGDQSQRAPQTIGNNSTLRGQGTPNPGQIVSRLFPSGVAYACGQICENTVTEDYFKSFKKGYVYVYVCNI